MKKLCFFICAVVASTASADNTITSKEYVDGEIAGLQIQIPAKNINTVVTNTGTAGTIGEKAIYNANNDYAEQQDALVDAQTFNTAVQNALESEFVCVEWQGSVHDNAHCLLYEVRGAYHKSKNLFDIDNAKVLWKSPKIQATKTATGYALTTSPQQHTSGEWAFVLVEIGNIDDFVGKTLRLSATTTCANPRFTLGYTDATGGTRSNIGNIINVTEQSGGQTKLAMWLYGYAGTDDFCNEYSNIQIEEGTVATPYVPYGNVYMPQAN